MNVRCGILSSTYAYQLRSSSSLFSLLFSVCSHLTHTAKLYVLTGGISIMGDTPSPCTGIQDVAQVRLSTDGKHATCLCLPFGVLESDLAF